MTATTFSRLPLAAGSAVAASAGRAGQWALARYMRAPLSSTGLLAMVTLTALAASNALYFQTARHPAPFFTPSINTSVADAEVAPVPMPAPAQQQAVALPSIPAAAATDTTGSVAPVVRQAVPEAPVGNKQAFDVQKKLFELGLFNGKVDGFYGPMTANAIRMFEQRNGMTPTGALTPGVVDAILRSDATGVAPVAQNVVVAPPVPAIQVAPVVQPAPVVVQQASVAAQLPPLTPVDTVVDTVGSAAAQTIDSIVAAVDGGRGNSVAAAASIPALPLVAPQQAMPAPVQVASLENTQPAAAQQTQLAPANNTQLVSQIQKGLASLGFYHGSIDGHPGDSTARAIREFENFHSYRVTGQVNPDLVGLLRDAGASI